MPKTILITGGTGLIGTQLTEILLESGHTVKYLYRNPKKTDKRPFRSDDSQTVFPWPIHDNKNPGRAFSRFSWLF